MALTTEERMEIYKLRIFMQAPLSLPTLIGMPLLSAAVLWNFLPLWVLPSWTLLIYAVGSYRYYTWNQYRKLVQSEDIHLIRHRVRQGVIAMALMGAAWGSLGIAINMVGDSRAEAYIVLLIFGVSAGAIFSAAAWPPAALSYVLPMTVPFTISIILRMEWYFIAIGCGVIFYLSVMTSFVRQYNIWLNEFIRLQIRNDQLVSELTVARDKATQASVAKSRFLANVSHELRTPLNSILGFSEVIRDGVEKKFDTMATKEYAGYIYDSGSYLLRLINDILDYSKIEAARMEISFMPVSLKETLVACVSMIRQTAAKKEIDLIFNKDDDIIIDGDELRIRQIVMNLLSNAIKFTPAGGKVSLLLKSLKDNAVAISVMDTGIGMTPEEVNIALEPFGQVAAAQQGGLHGTGLGLPLSKALAELHGGALIIDSEKGQGTTVRVILPKTREKNARG